MKVQTKKKDYAKEIEEYARRLKELFTEMTKDLRASEQRYRSIVECAADAIIIIDKDNTVLSWNEGVKRIFEYQESEAVGKSIDSLIAHTDVEQEAAGLSQKVLAGETIQSFEAVRYTKSGEPRDVLISAAAVKDEDGIVSTVSLMYKDITDLTNAHKRLIQSEKQAALGVIAGSIGHELNNLVGGLLVYVRMLKKHSDKLDRVQETADILLSNLEKVALHGKNLLSLSRPTAPSFELLDLNEVLEDTTETLVLSGVLKRFTVERHYTDEVRHVHGDRNLIEQVVRNLEINAAHALEEGGTLLVGTSISEDGKFIEMEIRDTGSGIPLEVQEKIFQPFFSTKGEDQGTGLGLPIVKQIFEQHNGYLKLQSKVGEGTRVIVGIPIAKSIL